MMRLREMYLDFLDELSRLIPTVMLIGPLAVAVMFVAGPHALVLVIVMAYFALSVIYLVLVTTAKRGIELREQAIRRISDFTLRERTLEQFRFHFSSRASSRLSYHWALRMDAKARDAEASMYYPRLEQTGVFTVSAAVLAPVIRTYARCLRAAARFLHFIAYR